MGRSVDIGECQGYTEICLTSFGSEDIFTVTSRNDSHRTLVWPKSHIHSVVHFRRL